MSRSPIPLLERSDSLLALATEVPQPINISPATYFKCYHSDNWGIVDMFKSDWPAVMNVYCDLCDEASLGKFRPVLIIGKQGVPPFCLFSRTVFQIPHPKAVLDLEYQQAGLEYTEHFSLRLMLWSHFLDALT